MLKVLPFRKFNTHINLPNDLKFKDLISNEKFPIFMEIPYNTLLNFLVRPSVYIEEFTR